MVCLPWFEIHFMRALITGAGGTIGKVLCEQLERDNIEVITWKREHIPVDNYQRMEDFIRKVQPDILFHLAYASTLSGIENETWKINYEWTSELAWITKVLGVKFIFTSTNLVFSNRIEAPYTIQSIPDADSGYGFEKRKAEARIISQNPNAIIVRLGWQIGKQAGSNNMIDYLDRKMKEGGAVHASTRWKPACSMLEDTCEKLTGIATVFSPGIYMIDSNERWSFYEIAKALNILHNAPWNIIPDENYAADTRMKDERVNMISLKERLLLA